MEGSRVGTSIRSGDMVPLHRLRLGVTDVHRLQDAERVRGWIDRTNLSDMCTVQPPSPRRVSTWVRSLV